MHTELGFTLLIIYNIIRKNIKIPTTFITIDIIIVPAYSKKIRVDIELRVMTIPPLVH